MVKKFLVLYLFLIFQQNFTSPLEKKEEKLLPILDKAFFIPIENSHKEKKYSPLNKLHIKKTVSQTDLTHQKKEDSRGILKRENKKTKNNQYTKNKNYNQNIIEKIKSVKQIIFINKVYKREFLSLAHGDRVISQLVHMEDMENIKELIKNNISKVVRQKTPLSNNPPLGNALDFLLLHMGLKEKKNEKINAFVYNDQFIKDINNKTLEALRKKPEENFFFQSPILGLLL